MDLKWLEVKNAKAVLSFLIPSTFIAVLGLSPRHCRQPSKLQETKLPVRLINTTNEQRLVQRHETIPLRVKGDIKDVSSELDNRGYRLPFLDETSRILLLASIYPPNKTSSRFMITMKCVKRENNLNCPKIL
ncbi:hypothetical protein TNCV_622411 [Trichonephila clavipes]|nr:hypothetical protein TNCV_622411 [Trichonephila clavipes]